MAPNVIMMMRHGEKPADDGAPHGVDPHGRHDEHSLSVLGWTRAGALAGLFGHLPSPAHEPLVQPDRVFATAPTPSAKSMRELHTAGPIAERLGVPLDTTFEHGHEGHLAKSVLASDEDVLIVWHHGRLGKFVRHFDLVNADDVPQNWPDDRYDLFWILVREPDSARYRFVAISQRLLAIDADDV